MFLDGLHLWVRLFAGDRLTDGGAVSVRCVDHRHVDSGLGEQDGAHVIAHTLAAPTKLPRSSRATWAASRA